MSKGSHRFYATLLGREEEITDLIADFFFENLQEVFGGGNFSFDVYITKEGKVKLIDFNTWGGLNAPTPVHLGGA